MVAAVVAKSKCFFLKTPIVTGMICLTNLIVIVIVVVTRAWISGAEISGAWISGAEKVQ